MDTVARHGICHLQQSPTSDGDQRDDNDHGKPRVLFSGHHVRDMPRAIPAVAAWFRGDV